MADRRGISGKALARLDNTLGVPTFILNKDITGTNDIVSAVTQDTNDNDVDRAADIDDAYYDIDKGEDLSIVSTGASLSCTVFILCARV